MEKLRQPGRQAQALLLVSLSLFALTSCSNEPGTPAAPKRLVDEHAPIAGQPAKIVRSQGNSIYAFSFVEDGHVITCQSRVELDGQQQVVPQKQWSMSCSQPLLQASAKPGTIRNLSLPADSLFDSGKSSVDAIKPEGRRLVEQFAKLLRHEYSRQPALVISGYTDRLGSPGDNAKLSLARAEAVAGVLEQAGLARELISTRGLGSANPLAECPGTKATAELAACLAPNRRIDIQVIGN